MREYTPNYMIDCATCSSQMWHLKEITPEYIRIECGDCETHGSIVIDENSPGEKCMLCRTYFEIIEHKEDEHIILKCQDNDCGKIAEIWLQGDEKEGT